MPAFFAAAWSLLSVSLAGETRDALAPLAIRYLSNNGSLPPPHRRSTQITITAAGEGCYSRLQGYDQDDPAQRFATNFTLDEAALQGFARRVRQLGVMDLRWREQSRPPVGGPVVLVRLSQSGRTVDVPAFPDTSQQDLAAALRSAVLELLPETVLLARRDWERGLG